MCALNNSVEEIQNTSLMRLDQKEFMKLSAFIHKYFGIKMPPAKKSMLEARLQKRLRHLGMTNMAQYCKYIFSPEGVERELVNMIDVVTTNKTDFFRESNHFDYLIEEAVPSIIENSNRRRIKVWSAGCSTGEEPYTLAIVLSEFKQNNPGFDFSILATDISTKVLEAASKGVYAEDRIDPIPLNLKKKYFLRNKDASKKLVKIAPEIREKVSFRRLNFMDHDFGIREQLDIIFCRNVVIYFDRQTQEKLVNKFCRYLSPAGYLFMGHSETLHGMSIPLVQIAPTIYGRMQ